MYMAWYMSMSFWVGYSSLGTVMGSPTAEKGRGSGQSMSPSIPALGAQCDMNLCSVLTMCEGLSLGPVENSMAWQHGKDPTQDCGL